MADNGAPKPSVDPLKDAFVQQFDDTYESESGDPGVGGTDETQQQNAPSAPAAAEPAPATAAPEAVDSRRQGEAAHPTARPPADPSAPAGAAPADDPYAGTQPFNYDVAGEAKAFEGIYRVPGEGLLVPEDKVGAVQQVFAERDLFDRATREFQARTNELERLAAWTTRDDAGREQTLTGHDGLVAMRVDQAKLAASFQTLSAIFQPDAQTGQYSRLLNLLTTDPRTGGITLDTQALEHLLTTSDLAETRAEQAVRSQIQRFVQQASQAAQTPLGASAPAGGAPASSFDYAKDVQPIVKDALKSTSFDPAQFTEKDQKFLAAQLPRFLRPVTEDDRRYNPTLRVGAPIVDLAFAEVVKDRAELRAEQRTTRTSAEQAGKFNAGQERGRQPQRQSTPKPAAPAPSTSSQPAKQKADWDTPFQEFMSEALAPR